MPSLKVDWLCTGGSATCVVLSSLFPSQDPRTARRGKENNFPGNLDQEEGKRKETEGAATGLWSCAPHPPTLHWAPDKGVNARLVTRLDLGAAEDQEVRFLISSFP